MRWLQNKHGVATESLIDIYSREKIEQAVCARKQNEFNFERKSIQDKHAKEKQMLAAKHNVERAELV